MLKKNRNLYLNNISIKKSISYIFDYLKKEKSKLSKEYIFVNKAKGRVTAEAIISKLSNPLFLSSAMDGIATSIKYTKNAKETNPIILSKNQYKNIDTGEKVPDEYDCVIPIEEINYLNNNSIEIIKSYVLWENIRMIGEDIEQKELLFTENHVLNSYDLGVILNGGITKIKVWKKPKTVLIPTGNEILNPFQKFKKNKIIDCNTTVCSSILKEAGSEVIIFPIIKDNKILIKKNLIKALEIGDLIIIIAGSSAGRKDYTKFLVEEIGEFFFHGISIKPGKPTIIGGSKGKIILGIPGFPVAAVFALEIFALKIIFYLTKKTFINRFEMKAELTRKIFSQFGIIEIFRILIIFIYNKYKAIPISKGSSSLSTLSKADGLLEVPKLSQGYEKGEKIKIKLLKNKTLLKKRLIIQGSNDFTIDVLKNILKKINYKYEIISKNIGSIGGIVSIKNEEAHLAGIHIFDEKYNNYNINYVKKYLGNTGCLMHIANRQQGFILAKNNPLKIKNLNDIINYKARYVNRQSGSGTRILLDYFIKINQIDKNNILGYNEIVYTHLNVGFKIANKKADVGLGIYSIAKLYDLEFIPLVEESYDFCFLNKFINTNLFKLFKKCLKDKKFEKILNKYGGYNLSNCGNIINLKEKYE